ncbi:MAG: WbqC family protein [Candidatus Cryptobacteroides sp.]
MNLLLSTAYIPPIEYFAAMAAGFELPPLSVDGALEPSVVYLEACENYQKQSWRTRCCFLSANGPATLSVPVLRDNNTHKLPVRKIKPDYGTPWVRQHETAIFSAYGTSAYFEYYEDEFFALLEHEYDSLFALNKTLTEFFIRKTGICTDLRETDDFRKSVEICGDGIWQGLPYEPETESCDLREYIHPKRPNDIMRRLSLNKPYFQVFSDRFGFIPGLSIMDLLFNEGPDSIMYLRTL